MKHFFFFLFLCTLPTVSYSADQKELFASSENTRAFLKDAAKNGILACTTGAACLLASQGLPPHCSASALGMANACCSRGVEQCCCAATNIVPTTYEEYIATSIACTLAFCCPLDNGLPLKCMSTSCISCIGTHSLTLLLKETKGKIKTFINTSTFFTSINDEDNGE